MDLFWGGFGNGYVKTLLIAGHCLQLYLSTRIYGYESTAGNTNQLWVLVPISP